MNESSALKKSEGVLYLRYMKTRCKKVLNCIIFPRTVFRPSDKSAKLKFNFIVSHPNHMLWILKKNRLNVAVLLGTQNISFTNTKILTILLIHFAYLDLCPELLQRSLTETCTSTRSTHALTFTFYKYVKLSLWYFHMLSIHKHTMVWW